MLGLLSYALKQVIIELCQEKSSNHEKHGWNFYSQAVFLQPLFGGDKRDRTADLLNAIQNGVSTFSCSPKPLI